MRRALAPKGRLVVHAGAAGAGSRAFWTVESTLRSAGLRPAPYAVARPRRAGAPPQPRDWGFVLARHRAGPGPHALLPEAEPARSGAVTTLTGAPPPSWLRPLSPPGLRQAQLRAERFRLTGLPPSTLTHPRY